jgi:hypothetical protein
MMVRHWTSPSVELRSTTRFAREDVAIGGDLSDKFEPETLRSGSALALRQTFLSGLEQGL